MTETETAPDCAWIHYGRPRPHWYLLSAGEQAALRDRWAAVPVQGGARNGRFHIRGQHDFEFVEFWRFPSSAAAYGYWQALCAARYAEFFAFSNHIGLEMAEA